MGKSIIDESHPHYAGLYNGIVSSTPETKLRVESHDVVLQIGPFPISANMGGFSNDLAEDRLIKLHPHYCSIRGKRWDGLDFRPVVNKLLAQLNATPLPRRNNGTIQTKPSSQVKPNGYSQVILLMANYYSYIGPRPRCRRLVNRAPQTCEILVSTKQVPAT